MMMIILYLRNYCLPYELFVVLLSVVDEVRENLLALCKNLIALDRCEELNLSFHDDIEGR